MNATCGWDIGQLDPYIGRWIVHFYCRHCRCVAPGPADNVDLPVQDASTDPCSCGRYIGFIRPSVFCCPSRNGTAQNATERQNNSGRPRPLHSTPPFLLQYQRPEFALVRQPGCSFLHSPMAPELAWGLVHRTGTSADASRSGASGRTLRVRPPRPAAGRHPGPGPGCTRPGWHR